MIKRKENISGVLVVDNEQRTGFTERKGIYLLHVYIITNKKFKYSNIATEVY